MRSLKYLMSLAMVVSGGSPLWADEKGGGDPCQQVVDDCKKAGQVVDNHTQNGFQNVADQKGGQHEKSSGGAAVSGAACINYALLADTCNKQQTPKCKTACKTKGDGAVKKCEKDIADYVANAQTNSGNMCNAQNGFNNTAGATGGAQPASTGDSGGGMSSGMMTGLMGAAIGGLAGYMLGQQQKKNDQQPPAAIPALPADGALQANGTLDCSKADAYIYQDCADLLGNQCLSEISSGTYASDAKCQTFGNRYCGTAGSTAPAVALPAVNLGDGVAASAMTTAMPPIAQSGQGLGTPFCKARTAMSYCGVAGRSQCPSCMQLARTQNAACTTNPALCVTQNSVAQLAAAKTTCPTDPAFADPTFLSTLNAGSAGSPIVAPTPTIATTASGALPVVVLPQSKGSGVAATKATSSSGSTGRATSSSSSMAIASVGGGAGGSASSSVATPGGVAREGQPSGPSAGHASGGGGTSSGGAAGSATMAYAPSSVDRVASSGGGDSKTAAGSVGRGPASDVQGQFGPSLFAMSTQVIRQRCQAGKLNNCP